MTGGILRLSKIRPVLGLGCILLWCCMHYAQTVLQNNGTHSVIDKGAEEAFSCLKQEKYNFNITGAYP